MIPLPFPWRTKLGTGAKIIADECSRPIMRLLGIVFAVEIAFVFGGWAYLHFTAASGSTPARDTAHHASEATRGGEGGR